MQEKLSHPPNLKSPKIVGIARHAKGYAVTLQGFEEKPLVVSEPELRSFKRFHLRCLDVLTEVFDPVPRKWLHQVRAALREAKLYRDELKF